MSKCDLKVPKNKTKFFFEKVGGKQFHGTYCECDDFCIRLQVRKYPRQTWNELAWELSKTDWRTLFQAKGLSSGNKNQLVSSWRVRHGTHSICIEVSKSYKEAVERRKKNPKLPIINFVWPTKCRINKWKKIS